MRNAFIRGLMRLAEAQEQIVLITGDLGFGVLDEFERRFPRQYLNAGVAEQNMTAIATGMAMEGHIVFTYSIGNFPILRCLEQIRNDACYHEVNVKIVSIGGGFSYGQLGMSHHATEDLSIMRAVPGIVVCCPSSAHETELVLDALVRYPGPAYLRLERAAAAERDDVSTPFEFGRARMIRDGKDITLIAAGGIVSEAIVAADSLRQIGVNARVLAIHSLKPLDRAAIFRAAEETGGILTIEENTVLGGLGGAVAEVCLEHQVRPKRFLRLGIPDAYLSLVGDQDYLRAKAGLDHRSIEKTVREVLDPRR